jgi:GNAT superfamily N-acetyltransferase
LSNADGRNSISLNGYIFYPVTDYAVFTGFSCGHSDLDDFLRNDAVKHAEQLLAVTYALSLAENPARTPLAFASLLNDAARMDKSFRRKLPNACRYSVYPAVKIGRLGVRREAQGKHVGGDLLNIIRTLFLLNNRTGCRLVTVDAYREASGFYQRNGFQCFSSDDENEDTRAMFFDLARFKPDSR